MRRQFVQCNSRLPTALKISTWRYQTRQRNHPKRAKHYTVIDGQLFRALTSKKKDTETLGRVIKDATARKEIFEGCHRGWQEIT